MLCAGAINSPQLLELSGIGDAQLPARASASRCSFDSPAVGEGLQDHLAVSYFYRSRVPTLNNELAPLLRQGARGAALRCSPAARPARDERQPGGRLPAQPRRACAARICTSISTRRATHHDARLQAPPAQPGPVRRAFSCPSIPAGRASRGSASTSARPTAQVSPAIQLNSLAAAEDMQRRIRRRAASCARSPPPPRWPPSPPPSASQARGAFPSEAVARGFSPARGLGVSRQLHLRDGL